MKRLLPEADHPEIPPDREGGSSSWVHLGLILSGRLAQVSSLALLPLWIGLTALVSWLWQPLWISGGAGFALFLLLDAVMLAFLPRTHRSWGPVTPPLLGLAVVRLLFFAAGGLLAGHDRGLGVTLLANAALSGMAFYATWIEPFQIHRTRMRMHIDGWSPGESIRVMHISDIHFERASLRETRLLDLVREERADLLLLTGDYLNLSSVYDPTAQQGVRHLLAQLTAPLGVYAITGSPVVDIEGIVPEIFDGLDIRWLDDEAVPVDVSGHTLWLLGVRNTYDEQRDTQALEKLADATPEEAFRVLLYHTPDLMPVAAKLGVDLYMCGHTHGGQIRLPGYGAVATSSRWGKRYEQGRYQEGETTLYVSRGLGLEGLGAPRARFLAPPEIIVWELEARAIAVSVGQGATHLGFGVRGASGVARRWDEQSALHLFCPTAIALARGKHPLKNGRPAV